MRILGIERDNLAVNHYRIVQPLWKLRDQGLADVIHLREDAQDLINEDGMRKVFESDIIVAHRPSSPEWFTFMKEYMKHGKLMVFDYDDDPFNTSPWNPYYRYVGTKNISYKWPDGQRHIFGKTGCLTLT